MFNHLLPWWLFLYGVELGWGKLKMTIPKHGINPAGCWLLEWVLFVSSHYSVSIPLLSLPIVECIGWQLRLGRNNLNPLTLFFFSQILYFNSLIPLISLLLHNFLPSCCYNVINWTGTYVPDFMILMTDWLTDRLIYEKPSLRMYWFDIDISTLTN